MTDRLVRLSNEKVVGGVCSGLANYFEIDVTIVRLAFVLSVIFAGVSPLVYLVLWIIIPLDRDVAHKQALTATPQPAPHLPASPQQDPTGEWKYDPYTGQPVQRS